jgi:hypothetical protein
MSDIERDLESELHRVLDPLASAPIPARRTVRPRGPVKTLLGGAGAALTIKVLTGVAVAAAAVTVAGAATTHSLDPSVWGQQVKQQVETCKDQLAQGDHGIGDCVSGFANQHGQTVASDARQHGSGSGNGNGPSNDKNGNGNGNGNSKSNNGNDNGKDKPKPSPNNEPNEPTDPSTHAIPKVSPKP